MPPRQQRCTFCKTVGHTIKTCDNQEGNDLYRRILNHGILCLRRHQFSMNRRARVFHSFIHHFNMNELKLFLAKINAPISGVKHQLSARIIKNYFYDILINDNPIFITAQDAAHKTEYIKYWWHISIGVSTQRALRELQEYFELINNMVFSEGSQQQTIKFPITVLMKPLDLTQDTDTFECCICMEEECSLFDKVDLNCPHSFCKECITRVLTDSQEKQKPPSCALCRTNVTTMHITSSNNINEIKQQFCSV